jgi:hypothetical protein
MKDPARLVAHEDPHGYTLDGFPIPSQSAVLAGAGYLPPFDGVPEGVLRFASYRGTEFHKATIAVERGLPVQIPEDLYDDLSHRLAEFERFLGDHTPELAGAEESGWNEDFYYAGTWDRLYILNSCKENERPARMDIKTSAKPSPWWAVQLCLYNLIDGGSDVDRYALWFPKKGRYQMIPGTELSRQSEVEDYADAIAALRTYSYRVRHKIIEGIVRPPKTEAT